MTTFTDLLKSKGINPKPNQEKFFDLIYNHLIGEDKYLIARGGMGLGKTISALVAVKILKGSFDKVYIATPFSMIKDEWMKESNLFDIPYSPWISKYNCLNIFHSDIRDCNDECEHRKGLEANDIFTDLCYKLTEDFLLECPITASEYYKKYGENYALWSIVKCGLLNRSVSIGDFIPLFIPSMNQKMIFGEHYNKYKSIIILDEAQRFIPRAKNFFSKTLVIDDLIKRITQKEIRYLNNNPKEYASIMQICAGLKDWRDKIIKSFNKDKEMKYSYQEFCSMLETYCKKSIEDIVQDLKILSLRIEYDKFDTEENHPQIHRFINFLDMWKNININNYEQYVNFLEYNQKLKLNLTCIDISDKIPKLLEPYKKVIFMSGTIGESFIEESGLKNIKISEKITSYDLSENIFIYPRFDFISKKRNESLKEITELLNQIINTMEGRIILFLPSTQISKEVINIIKSKRTIYNCCNSNQEEKSKMSNEFSKSKEGILLFGFNQGIEGQNFIDEMNFAVENSIFLGYPFMRRGIVYDGELNFKIKKYGNKETANRFQEYIPIGESIHQCLARTKRNELDEPINILIGTQFNNNTSMNACLPNELTKNIIYDKINLIEQIKRKNELRRKKRDIQFNI